MLVEAETFFCLAQGMFQLPVAHTVCMKKLVSLYIHGLTNDLQNSSLMCGWSHTLSYTCISLNSGKDSNLWQVYVGFGGHVQSLGKLLFSSF